LSTKLIASLRTDVATADFLWYRGLYEIEAALVHFWESTFDESELRFRFFPGGPSHLDPTAGGQELTLRLKPRANTFVPTLFAQVFHGYGENMLDYKTRRFVFRVGLGF
jgi:outer membrane phospholipase A